jgi:putative glutamine amidotransferase
MAVVAITSSSERNARRYVAAMEATGSETRVLLPDSHGVLPAEELMRGSGGLLLSGGPDVHPGRYGQQPNPNAGLQLRPELDELEFRVLDYALSADMPVLAICRGMQVLNVAFGGRLTQHLDGHRNEDDDPASVPASHLIYVAPGAKSAAIIGSAGFFKVNSYHHQGLTEAQRAPRLMSTAYSVDDGLVEGLESPEHSWVIGLQCHPERLDEVPRLFVNLFAGLHDRAERFAETLPV